MRRPMTRTTLRLSSALALALTALAHLSSAAAQETETAGIPTPFANNYGSTETARTTAMGGALRSLGTGTAGMFLNPATIALKRLYHVEGILQTTPEVGRLMAGGVIVDSILNRYGLAGGVAVLGGFLDPDGTDWSSIDVRGALGYPISSRLFIGTAARYASLSQGSELAPPAGGGSPDLSTLSLHVFTLDVGVTVKPTESFYFSLVGQDVVSNHRGAYPTTIGGGVAYGTEIFSVALDGLADLHSYGSAKARFMAGGELLVAEVFPIRLGYQFDQGAGLHSLSAGLGYVGTEFAFEASVRRTLSDPGATTIVVGLAYHVESSSLVKQATEGYSMDQE
jgi:hypothetical protein